MNYFPTLRALVFSVTLLAPIGRAQDNVMKSAAAPAAAVHFARLDRLDLAQILPPPPAPGSLAAAADLSAVLQAQAWRTPEQVAWAKLVDKGGYFAVFAFDGLLGPQFSKENCPALAALFDQSLADGRPINDAAKKLYSRMRPFLVDPRVQPVIERPSGNSYPSGHATGAHLWAAVLAEIYPDKRAKLFERADRAAWGRVIAGVHFPTDLEGGRRLAAAIVAEELKSAAFRAALEKCRAEAAALGLLKKAA